MRCCLIGGAGFIGVQVARLLVETGRNVVVVGRRSKPDALLPPSVTYVSGDYGNRGIFREVLADVDELVDLAYATVPQTSFADPAFDILANLPPTVGMLQEAARAGVRKLVLVSSGGTVYGVTSLLPIREDHPTHPISPYGITKLTIENYGRMFAVTHGLPVVIVRPGNAYGEEQRPFSGQGFVATAVHSILGRKTVSIFGPEGTVRDYVHVSDVARGIVAALERGRAGEAYNIGTGIGASNRDLIGMLEPLAATAGVQISIETLPARHFDVPANVLDSSKLGLHTGWKPLVALGTGVAAVWKAAREGMTNSPS